MSHATLSPLSRLKLAVVPLLMLALTACASGTKRTEVRLSYDSPPPALMSLR